MMKGGRLLVVLLLAFGLLLSLWLHADTYPYPLYEYYETGKYREYLDRMGGWEVDRHLVYMPDNPAWVPVVRRISPLTLFLLGLAILYFVTPALERKIKRKGAVVPPGFVQLF